MTQFKKPQIMVYFYRYAILLYFSLLLYTGFTFTLSTVPSGDSNANCIFPFSVNESHLAFLTSNLCWFLGLRFNPWKYQLISCFKEIPKEYSTEYLWTEFNF